VFAFADELYSRFVEAGVAPRPADHGATVAVQAGMWLTALLLGDHVTRFLGEGAGEPIETQLGRATIELLRYRTLD
jgi:hypothetical protein